MRTPALLLLLLTLAFAAPADAEPPLPTTQTIMPDRLNTGTARVIDPILSEVARGYTNGEFVGNALFPTVPVDQAGGTIIEFGKESFQLYNSRRAPGGATRRVQYGYAGDKYALETHGLEGVVPFEFMREANQVPGIDLGRGAVELVMQSHALILEHDQASIARGANNYDATHKEAPAGTDKWSDPDSKPIVQINDAKETVRRDIGRYPNTLVLGPGAMTSLKENPSLIEKIKYTSRDSITAQIIAQLFDVERVYVGTGVYSDGDDGPFTDIWGNDAVLAFVPSGSSMNYQPAATANRAQPSYGYTYVMRGNPAVEQPYQDRNQRSWIYPAHYERDAVQSGMAAGFLFQNVK